jgi:hypothetical protein
MDFPTLVAEVVKDTNRPDMSSLQGGDGQIEQKVASSTLYLHSMDYFLKDILEASVIFDQAAFIQTLDTTEFPRFRSLAYARKDDPTLSSFQQNPSILPPLFNSSGAVNMQQSMAMFELITADSIFDELRYGSEKLDVMYQAGDVVNFKSSSSFKQLRFGWYAFPNVDTSANGVNFKS